LVFWYLVTQICIKCRKLINFAVHTISCSIQMSYILTTWIGKYVILKVSKSRKQIMMSSILPKNQQNKFNLRYHNTVRSKFFVFSFVFWENWGYHKLLSKFSDLYLGIRGVQVELYIGHWAPTYLLLVSHWANGARNGVISIGQWDVFNHKKGAIWQSHLAAQKEGVVTTIIFSNHKTY
jgi:hypothetical protein